MINLIVSPQQSDNYSVKYSIEGDILTVSIKDLEEIFDFTGFEEGMAEEIIAEVLPINPIISAEKIGDTINIIAIRFYVEDEKEVFDNGTN